MIRRIAPAVIRCDRTYGENGPRGRKSVGTVQDTPDRPGAARTDAVALAPFQANASTAHGAGPDPIRIFGAMAAIRGFGDDEVQNGVLCDKGQGRVVGPEGFEPPTKAL